MVVVAEEVVTELQVEYEQFEFEFGFEHNHIMSNKPQYMRERGGVRVRVRW